MKGLSAVWGICLVSLALISMSSCATTGGIEGAKEMRTMIEMAYEEMWNQGNVDVIDELYSEDYYYWAYPILPEPCGRECFKKRVLYIRKAIPDFHIV